MLRITNQTTPTTLNNVGRLMLSGLVTAATFAAISFASSAAIGQEKETMDPPTPAATPTDEQTDEPAATDTEAMETKTVEAPVAMKKLSIDLLAKELSFEAPESWKAKKPRYKITKHELQLPKAEGEAKDGRMTFTPPNKVFAVEKKKIDGYELSIVQLRGTFMESSGGPFSGKKPPRENYMMKAVIISPVDADAKTPKCFIKLVGSEKTLKQHAKAYDAMVKSMKTQAVVE